MCALQLQFQISHNATFNVCLCVQIVEAGCVFSVDQCEVMQNHLQMMQVPRQQMDIFLAVKCRYASSHSRTVIVLLFYITKKPSYDVTHTHSFLFVCRALVTNPHTSELSNLAQAVVRVEVRSLPNFCSIYLHFYICSFSFFPPIFISL